MPASANIILIDDEPMILSSLERLFEDDYTVYPTTEPDELFRRLKSTEIKVIVSDQRMPKLLGNEVLAKAREISPATMRILLTGFADLDAVVSSINESEIFRYINKPWNAARLLETVKLATEIYDRIASPGALIPLQGEITERQNILVVSHDASQLETLRALFASQYEVITASTVSEVFTKLPVWNVSVVLFESLQDNHIDEVEFLTMLRTLYPDTSLVMYTHARDTQLAGRLINEGNIFRYVLKPVSNDVLQQIVFQSVLTHNFYRKAPKTNPRRIEEEIFISKTPPPITPNLGLAGILDRLRNRLDVKKNY
ncbi:MAG: response regulator [Chloroherpetonaceae bacterium]|nr:response regulator [Chloroherpetonaceae bacterium]